MKRPAPIVLDDPRRPVDPALLDMPGAFVWWYVDAIDDVGDGVVLIWSFGLPFLPGVLSSARAGRPIRPREAPALNVVTYRRGRESSYLLQRFAAEDAEWGDGYFRFGASRIVTSTQHGVRRVLASIDTAIPRSSARLRGRITLEGSAATNVDAAPGGDHAWTPLTGPAKLVAELVHGEERFCFAGRAYHDRNYGTKPLDQLGIDTWSWGRIVRPSHTSIHYLVNAEAGTADVGWLVDVNTRGVVEARSVERVEQPAKRRVLYGMPHAPRTHLSTPGDTATIEEPRLIDRGPFYLRSVLERDGAKGVAEHVCPARIDRALLRPLVRMRVHDVQRNSSWWLPLFSGPERGRWARLLGLERKPVAA